MSMQTFVGLSSSHRWVLQRPLHDVQLLRDLAASGSLLPALVLVIAPLVGLSPDLFSGMQFSRVSDRKKQRTAQGQKRLASKKPATPVMAVVTQR